MKQRLQIAGFFAAMVFLLIGIRLIHLQIFEGSSYAKTAFNEHYRLIEKKPRRGSVTDCRGRLLAVSLAGDSLYCDPKLIKDPVTASNILSAVIGGESHDYIPLLTNKNRRFCWLSRGLTPAQSEILRNWTLPGVFFRKEMNRFYPAGTSTGSITGITDIDGAGLEGVEIGMETVLAGKKGMEILAHDALLRPYQPGEIVIREPELGQDIRLTIDLAVQHFASRLLQDVVHKEQAKWAAAVVMDIDNGAILALSSEPGFDPNDFSRTSAQDRRNHCLTDLVEPGSTFKAVTFATVLDMGLCDLAEKMNCQNGRISIGKETYNDWKKFSLLSAEDVLVYSSNVGTILLGQRAGGQAISDMARQLGICKPLEVPIPGIQTGYIRSFREWPPSGTASLSIGYGIATTALHLAAAYSIFANDGVRIPPHLIDTELKPVQVMKPETAILLSKVLEQVVSRGTGHLGQPRFYTAAGKTGTARRYDPEKGCYIDGQIVCVFAGFAPAGKPKIAVCVVVDDPRESIWASQVAAPIFGQLVDQTLIYLGIPSDKTSSDGHPLEQI